MTAFWEPQIDRDGVIHRHAVILSDLPYRAGGDRQSQRNEGDPGSCGLEGCTALHRTNVFRDDDRNYNKFQTCNSAKLFPVEPGLAQAESPVLLCLIYREALDKNRTTL